MSERERGGEWRERGSERETDMLREEGREIAGGDGITDGGRDGGTRNGGNERT